MIKEGELKPGQRLPGEVELSARLGVSRGSVREAQKMLAVAGVLDPTGKPQVSDMQAEDLMTGLAMVVPLLPIERLLELFPLREVLESHLVALATARASQQEIEDLEALAREIAAMPCDDPVMAEKDHYFHSRLIVLGGDPMIAALLETIHQRGGDYHVFAGKGAQEFKERSDQGHLRMMQVMKERNAEVARALMVEHIRNTRIRLEDLYLHNDKPA